MELVPPLGREEVPDTFLAASSLFASARAKSVTGDTSGAAADFLAAAQVMHSPVPNPYAPLFRENRVSAYANAAIAWLDVGQQRTAIELLERSKAADPDCGPELDELIRVFS